MNQIDAMQITGKKRRMNRADSFDVSLILANRPQFGGCLNTTPLVSGQVTLNEKVRRGLTLLRLHSLAVQNFSFNNRLQEGVTTYVV